MTRIFTRGRLAVLASVAVCISSQIVHAEDPQAPPTAAEKARQDLLDRTASLNAQAGLDTARAALLKARVDALNLPTITAPATPAGSTAGHLEGMMLASGAVEKAAEKIRDGVPGTGEPILLVTGEGRIDFEAAELLPIEMKAFTDQVDDVLDAMSTCRAPGSTRAAQTVPLAAIGAVLSLLRTETTVEGFSLSLNNALLNAVAARLRTRFANEAAALEARRTATYNAAVAARAENPSLPAPDPVREVVARAVVVPSEAMRPDRSGKVISTFEKLIDARNRLQVCRDLIAPRVEVNATKVQATADLAVLDGLTGRIDTYVARISTPAENGPSVLVRAALGRILIDRYPDGLVLRLNVEQAGGSILRRANLWTALGAPAIGITGGVVATWRLSDPIDGSVRAGGLLVCRTNLTNLNAIQDGRAGLSSCDPQQAPPRNAGR